MKDIFYRHITHKGYKSKKIAKDLEEAYVHVPKRIVTNEVVELTPENTVDDKNAYCVDHKYIAYDVTDRGIAIWGGAFVCLRFCFFYGDEI